MASSKESEAESTIANESESVTGPDLIKSHLNRLPTKPGVYRMVDAEGSVLYVGKAQNLRKRVAAYAKVIGHTNRISRMIAATADLEIVTTNTETEALLLEANLIKRLKPRYNVLMRDDKSFPYILVTGDHDFPQVLKHRGARNQKGEYFGPFASAGAVNRTLNTLQRAFLLRSCSGSVFESRTRPCLLYQIKRCSAPCVDWISREAYGELVEETTNFLKGKNSRTQKLLSQAMEEASKTMDFERAALYRDRIKALTAIQAHQGINPEKVKDADVFAAARDGGQICIQIFFFRAGQNWGNRAYFPRHDKTLDTAEVLDSFLAQFYESRQPALSIMLSESVPGQSLLQDALSIKAERKVIVQSPKRGERRKLVEHALANARDAIARRLAESDSQRRLLEAVGETFDLDRVPKRIEVFDNSHIRGDKPVGAMIVSGPNGFIKSEYRKFNIQGMDIPAGDDYGMMREVFTRRFSRLLRDSDKTDKPGGEARTANGGPDWPDLVLIDGGAGHLSAVQGILADLGIKDVNLVAIAKGLERNAGHERFFVPGQPPFSLEPKSAVLYYLQRLRDEAHRYAIGSHRNRRKKDIRVSSLDDVPGIGAKRKRALLHHFGSAKAIRQAGLSDLETVDGISHALAKRIYDYFQNDH